jgi:hypothetical protein
VGETVGTLLRELYGLPPRCSVEFDLTVPSRLP